MVVGIFYHDSDLMKKLLILFIPLLSVLNIYSQKVNYYQTGSTGEANLRAMVSLRNNGFIHTFDSRYEGIKGTPNLFNSLIISYMKINGEEKYVQVESDIDILRNSVIFRDPSTLNLMEISSDNVKELIFNIYDKDFIYRTTKGLKFEKKIKENKFYQVIEEKPYLFIMITFKSFLKADDEPAFNSGRNYDEYRTYRKYYLEDFRGVFHQVILNNITYDCIIHPSKLNKRGLAKMFPEKKELIYRAFEEKPDSVTIERIFSILNSF
jgi:hypothetical protein